MAKPIQNIQRMPISEEAKKERDLEDIQQALTEHKTAILEAIDVLQGLHDRGLLPLLNNLLAEGDKVLAIAMKELNKEQNSRALQNLSQLAVMIGSLDLDQLKPVANGVNAGLQQAAAQTDEQTGFISMWKTIKDPDVQRAVSILFGFLKGLGNEYARQEE